MSDKTETQSGPEVVLWARDGARRDDFVRLDEAEQTTAQAVVYPLEAWLLRDLESRQGDNRRSGVIIAAGEALDILQDDFDQLDLIVLDFPAFNDGRAFSKAALLKSHYGFRGEVRATGAIFTDQVVAMLRAGFDTLEIRDPLTLQRLKSGNLHDTGVYYQPVAGSVAGSELNSAVEIGAAYAWRRQASQRA